MSTFQNFTQKIAAFVRLSWQIKCKGLQGRGPCPLDLPLFCARFVYLTAVEIWLDLHVDSHNVA